MSGGDAWMMDPRTVPERGGAGGGRTSLSAASKWSIEAAVVLLR